jgi:hypothetical protein
VADAVGDGDAERVLSLLGAQLAAQIVAVVPDWVGSQVARIADAWAATPAGRSVDRVALRSAAAEAGAGAAEEVGRRLADLAAADVDAQSTTPLEIVRAAVVWPTAVLQAAGVPAVVRDAFDEDRFPDDLYGLTPASLTALDGSLTDTARAWGAAKAMAHKARHGGTRA